MQVSPLLPSKICIHFKSQQLHTQADMHEAPDTVATCIPGPTPESICAATPPKFPCLLPAKTSPKAGQSDHHGVPYTGSSKICQVSDQKYRKRVSKFQKS